MVAIPLSAPDGALRRRFWAAAAQRAGLLTDAPALTNAAERFRLSAWQIDTATLSLRLSLGLKPREQATVGADALVASARRQAGVELGGLAQRIAPEQGWQDLVLPPACLTQLRRLGGAIRHRERVFAEWGFTGGPGVTALFSGSPGTGKSMSAAVIAREAGLDLWRIDLSAVVSKYIGETEKHLDRVFALARDGNAILFFDEADALFGKRSEVKDAHDRYANIEVAFLLQRLEAFDGVVILASNLAGNVDPAFSRRMHFVVEFPLPDPALRERLWRAAIPKRAPVADDVDLAFLAREFTLTGGDIRVAALDAAFAAAADEEAIDMGRLCKAVSRQLLKKGKVPDPGDFRQYQALLASAEARMAAE
jgi:ATPase family associated with various cellular activities (AAA)